MTQRRYTYYEQKETTMTPTIEPTLVVRMHNHRVAASLARRAA